jgi:hypothetical protein
VTIDGPLGWVIEIGFVACMVVLLVFLIQQYRRSGKDD